MKSVVGKTKDVGFQVGARKTINVNYNDLWDFMFSVEGLNVWLGDTESTSLEVPKEFSFANGTTVKVTVFEPYSHVRMIWKKKKWQNNSRLQVRVIDSRGKSVVAFHQELLRDVKQRKEMKSHWKKTLERLSDEFEKTSR